MSVKDTVGELDRDRFAAELLNVLECLEATIRSPEDDQDNCKLISLVDKLDHYIEAIEADRAMKDQGPQVHIEGWGPSIHEHSYFEKATRRAKERLREIVDDMNRWSVGSRTHYNRRIKDIQSVSIDLRAHLKLSRCVKLGVGFKEGERLYGRDWRSIALAGFDERDALVEACIKGYAQAVKEKEAAEIKKWLDEMSGEPTKGDNVRPTVEAKELANIFKATGEQILKFLKDTPAVSRKGKRGDPYRFYRDEAIRRCDEQFTRKSFSPPNPLKSV